MCEYAEPLCPGCGGRRFGHVESVDHDGRPQWRNRCLLCGRESEYMPTPDEIRFECLKIRCEQGRVEVSDELEKFWRRHSAERSADEDDDPPPDFED